MSDLEPKVYVDDVGTVFEVDAIEDIHDATALKILVKKPSATTTEWAATLKAGTLTVLRHVAILGDLDEAGLYCVQAKVTLPAGTWRGRTTTFPVAGDFG